MDTFLIVLGIYTTIAGICMTSMAVLSTMFNSNYSNEQDRKKRSNMLIAIILVSIGIPFAIFVTLNYLNEPTNEPTQEIIEHNDFASTE